MSYNKTIWSAGDTITAEKLNNIEEGIEAVDQKVPAFPEFSYTRNVSGSTLSESLSLSSSIFMFSDGKPVVDYTSGTIQFLESATNFIPSIANNKYYFMGTYYAESDKREVKVNGVSCPWDGRKGYTIYYEMTDYTTSIDLVITDKEDNVL